jgi:flavin-dependent dehydrogenase
LSSAVRIAGAGPAGLSAALVLARRGFSVEVHERADRLGARFFGDLHGVENWSSARDFISELEAAGIARNFECAPNYSVLMTNGRHTRSLRGDRPIFYLVSRGGQAGSLEHGLAEQARAAGVRIVFGSRARDHDVQIVATGPRAKARVCIEVGWRFETEMPDVAIGLVHDGAAPAGYAYLLIRSGIGCLCTVLFDRFSEARTCLARARELFERASPLGMRSLESIGGYGTFALNARYRMGSASVVGEAAGLQDFVWGFGIRTAMASGRLAAECWLSKRDYAREAEGTYGAQQRASVVSRFLWENTVHWAFPLYLRQLGKSRLSLRALRFAYEDGWAQRMLFPLALRRARQRFAHLTGGAGAMIEAAELAVSRRPPVPGA